LTHHLRSTRLWSVQETGRGGPTVAETVAELTSLHREMLGAVVERRRGHPPGGPTRLQEFALLAIRDRGGMGVSELGTLLEISSATTSQLLGAMERRGWLQREMLAADRRRHRVSLTAAGEELVRGLEQRRRERLARLLAAFSGEERGQLITLARRLLEILRRSENPGEVL
jgi:DNA-binding MarR family transcriptional regulator